MWSNLQKSTFLLKLYCNLFFSTVKSNWKLLCDLLSSPAVFLTRKGSECVHRDGTVSTRQTTNTLSCIVLWTWEHCCQKTFCHLNAPKKNSIVKNYRNILIEAFPVFCSVSKKLLQVLLPLGKGQEQGLYSLYMRDYEHICLWGDRCRSHTRARDPFVGLEILKAVTLFNDYALVLVCICLFHCF